MHRHPSSAKPTTTNRRFLVPALLAALICLLTACGDGIPDPDENVSVADVAEAEVPEGKQDRQDQPGLANRVVTVEGEILEILDAGAFLIGDPGVLEPAVLVMSPSADFADQGMDAAHALVEDETVVEVTGTVRRLSLGEFQEDYAIPYDVYEEYAGEAVLVAESVEILQLRE
ncbi:hypothetical protein ACQEVI_03605 [Promicromonospora sp. CA-289599]|uniref:hypothetical protein n=1 Tax=Promicromonospora sp. CA-289599 TaxID=3240014 RepID=UPI003D92FC18